MKKVFYGLLLWSGCFGWNSAWAGNPAIAEIEKVFLVAKSALKERKEVPFRKQWHPLGYEKNIVGSSGIPGRGVFQQGSRKRWYLRPEMKQISFVGPHKLPIVPCLIWSWKKNRPVDKVYAAVVWHQKRWVILGAGERRRQVELLALRFQKKEPLLPRKK